MTDDIQGQTIAFLTAGSGVEQVELTGPWQAVQDAGGTPRLIAPEPGSVQAFHHDVDKGDTFPVDATVDEVSEEDFDGLVLPGGTTNPDQLRLQPAAVALVKAFVEARKPVAAICHGPWTLVEADVLRGKTLTSWPSLRTDIVNAGGEWTDQEVFVCPCEGWVLVTSRNPDDLPAFNAQIVRTFTDPSAVAQAEGAHC
ncbi:type 1 glutamine amidotransferase domain-containing protein [Luteipulveratus halotolerans]|uniref:Glutamine amidotransferase n=1 Tax=Luteipulveratus halotolerans TaxID=1631356 RepID=A0A0L6CM54_9MICO|nr:type 1 glutamine amidotransferase domain-containing protein [Luteipulveratus halotolerans]KNX38715.1 glutamine amidotransferase [Luteipulveratus halotolerans]